MFVHKDENPFPHISKQRPRKVLHQTAARLAPPTWTLCSRTQYDTFNTEDSTLPTRTQYSTIQKTICPFLKPTQTPLPCYFSLNSKMQTPTHFAKSSVRQVSKQWQSQESNARVCFHALVLSSCYSWGMENTGEEL